MTKITSIKNFYRRLAELQNENPITPEMIKLGGARVAVLDMDCAFDVDLAKEFGVDLDDILISQPDSEKEAVKIGRVLQDEGCVVVAMHSPAFLPTANENLVLNMLEDVKDM